MKVVIGSVARPFGVRGELKIKLMTDFVEDRFVVGRMLDVVLGNHRQTVEIESVRHHQNTVLVKFKGWDSLNDVEKLYNARLEIDRDTMHDLDEDSYYFIDLLGCVVIADDEEIGTVIEVMDMPAHPVLRIKNDVKVSMVPFVETFIKSVDLNLKRIEINNMEGLL